MHDCVLWIAVVIQHLKALWLCASCDSPPDVCITNAMSSVASDLHECRSILCVLQLAICQDMCKSMGFVAATRPLWWKSRYAGVDFMLLLHGFVGMHLGQGQRRVIMMWFVIIAECRVLHLNGLVVKRMCAPCCSLWFTVCMSYSSSCM
jgi:hypothetical protein